MMATPRPHPSHSKAEGGWLLDVGDPIPDRGWIDMNGARVSLTQSANAGRWTILAVGSTADMHAAEPALRALREVMARLESAGVHVYAVAPGSQADAFSIAARLDLPFPVVSDGTGVLCARLGFAPARGEMAVIVVDPNQRVLHILRPGTAGDSRACAARAVALVEARRSDESATLVTAQAPVLLVPNVLTPEHCARVIRAWKTGQRYEGGVASAQAGNAPETKVKVREDVALADLGPEAQELFAVFGRRLFPQIRKAFNFRVTRAETLRVGCYTADDGGHFVPHRDDTTPYTAHRRFAISLNLNAGDYEGGYLRFPEFGPQLYSPPTGGAVVFSCSLLHEATRITAGRRFVLLGFFYGEAEQALRERLRAERGTRAG